MFIAVIWVLNDRLVFSKIVQSIVGYRVKREVSGELMVKTRYRGRLSGSDPLMPLKDIAHRLFENQQGLTSSFQFEACWSDRLEIFKNKHPNSSTTFGNGTGRYKLDRYVAKQGSFPLSLYSLSEGGEIVAIFSRVYDYGKIYAQTVEKLIPVPNREPGEPFLVTNREFGALVESFGHSQIFLWKDRSAVHRCLSLLK